MYSFGHARRFNSLAKTSENFFYDLPTFKSKRTTNFGYGTKSDFTKEGLKGKSQNYYNIPKGEN